jgi:SAM-dependent methyltransferase
MTETQYIGHDDFSRMFNCHLDELPEEFVSMLDRIDTTYREPHPGEFEEYILSVLRQINSPYITRTREENLEAFEKGWEENLEMLRAGEMPSLSLKPRYFRPDKFLRYDRKLIVSDNLGLEYDLFILARHIIFSKYLSSYDYIYELGCGSCQNLLLLSELFPSKSLFGLDWTNASVEIASFLSKNLGRNIAGTVFDMMNPSSNLVINPGSAVVTIHALEQIGTNHEKLLSFFMDSQAGIVLHYEPILEFYDENNLLDYLAIMYSKKRGYLSGFLTALRRLEKEGKIEILGAWRPCLGGILHESSLIIWKPR